MKQKNWLSVIILCTTTLVVVTCATSESKPVLESGWAHLDNVKGLECGSWPLREAELDVTFMAPDATTKGGFVAEIRHRNGSRQPVFTETKGLLDLDRDDFIPVPVGRDAYIIAPVQSAQEPVVIVAQNKNERAWLEVRSVKDNQLVARMATPLSQEASSGRLVVVDSGSWLQVNHDDREASYVHVAVTDASKWVFSVSKFQSHSLNAVLVGNSGRAPSFVIEYVPSKTSSESVFSVTRLDIDGSFKRLGNVKIPTKGGLESWSAVLLGQKLVIASVRGDSMVGQGVLIVSAIDVDSEGLLTSWRKEFAYDDVHVGEPVLLSNGTRALLGIMKWVDSESVFSRIKVDATSAVQLPDWGVFERGTILASGYLNGQNQGLGAFRYRSKELWKYKLCKLSL